MTPHLRYIFALLLMLCISLPVAAQETAADFTFESGARFDLPQNATIDTTGTIPTISIGRGLLVQMIDPGLLGRSPDATLNLPLLTVLDALLGMVGQETERDDDTTFRLTLDDGREAIAYDFVNATDAFQTIIVLRLSDGRVGALNIQSLEALTGEQRDIILELALSFDVGTGSASLTEETLTAGLAQEHAYESGVSFRYPEGYEIAGVNDPPVSIGILDVIYITMVDPYIVGLPADESMESIINFAIGSFDIEAESFEPFDIGGREAVIGSGESGEFLQSIVIVRFDDGTAGIMDIVSPGVWEDVQLEEVRSIAASFNSASADFTGVSRADFDQSRELFEQGMAAHEAREFDDAVDLFTQALELDDQYSLAYFRRAIANREIGEFESALADFQQVLELEPDQPSLHSSAAEIYALLGDVNAALAEMEAYIEKAGEDALSENDRWAYETYQRVLEGEYVADFYTSRSNRLRTAGRFEEAIRDIEFAIENEPDEPTLYARLGVIYIDMEQPDDAIQAFTDGIRAEPLAVLFYNRGFAYRDIILESSDAIINQVHDFQCAILLDDGSITETQVATAQRNITTTMIESDSYEPITDPADCVA